jgi:hypothetical protein
MGDLDFRRTFRRSLKVEGIPLELVYGRRKKRLKRMVILTDVSGSMDRYARFVLPFLLGLRGLEIKVEVFVFSTSLFRITKILHHYSVEEALHRISMETPDWSGGTRIGYSLRQFNENHREDLVSGKTVVVIMSDGWDLGAKGMLEKEMALLARKAKCVLWLNPLAGDPDYQPVYQGMKSVMPYIDYFLPADSLDSLKKVGRTLSRVMAGG